MKKLILLFVFVSAGLFTNAQGTATPKMDAEARAKKQVEKMTTELKLTADQQTKALPIVLEKVKAMETNRSTNGNSNNTAAFQDEKKRINDKFNTSMKAILTPDQITKLNQMETEKKADRASKKPQ